VSTALGLIGIVVFILAVLALSAAVTYAVVRLLPPPDEKKARQAKAEAGG
jgi:hypothetical protein